MTREQFIKTCALLGLALPPFTSIAFSSTFEYDVEAELYIEAREKVYGKLTDDEKTTIRMFVKLCKQSGTWDSLDALYCFKDTPFPPINWIKP